MIGVLLVAQLGIVTRVPDTASACVPFDVGVAVRTAGAATPRVDLPATGALQVLRARFTTRAERDSLGGAATLTEGSFLVASVAAGRVTVPAVVAVSGGATARSEPQVVDVRPAGSTTPLVYVRARLDAGAGRRTDSLFVGQQVDFVVDVQLNEPARERLRRNPTFFPPEMPAVLAYDLAPPPPVVRSGSRCFESLSYRRALFPLFAGRAVIPSATLTYSLPLSTSFFSREERFEVRTDSVQFVAVDPPAAGRPADFAGAVGDMTASARLDEPTGRMGDPVVLTLRLAATGNVKLLPRPLLTVDWATVALGEERVTVDTSAMTVRGTKEFDWLLTPRRAGQLTVPPIRYPHFDPSREGYDVAVTDSIPFTVASAALASADTGAAPRLPIRRTIREEAPAPMPSRSWYWLALGLAPLPATMLRLRRKRRARAIASTAGRRLRRLGTARRPPSPRELRRTFLEALEERVPLTHGAGASRIPVSRQLRRAGVTDATAIEAERVLERLDRAAFSASGVVDAELVARAVALAAAVDAEAIRRRETGGVVGSLVLVVLLASAAATAMPDGVARTFADGVRAYDRGELATAQRLFARTAARAPRASDAWANLGAAAWARNDTAHAVQGWQRALRLEPLDDEVRARLAAVQLPLVTTPGYVPPVATNGVALAALLLWVVAWLALAVQSVWRLPHLRPVAGGALALALVALAGALELQDRAGVRGLGVLRGARDLRDAPGEGAPASAAANAGEVVSLGVREGAWVRVSLGGDRAGWAPAAAVLPLDASGVD